MTRTECEVFDVRCDTESMGRSSGYSGRALGFVCVLSRLNKGFVYVDMRLKSSFSDSPQQ